MTYIVRFRPEAEEDIENAAQWIEEHGHHNPLNWKKRFY